MYIGGFTCLPENTRTPLSIEAHRPLRKASPVESIRYIIDEEKNIIIIIDDV
jgi:hypothetical protein